MDGFRLNLPIVKVDVAKRLVYGTAADETVDKAGERFHYDSSKPNFEAWSGEIQKASDGKSYGNVREMHQASAVGALTQQLGFDDDNHRIEACAKVVDEQAWRKVLEGVYTGFSIGGKYAKRWSDPNDPMVKWYTALPNEISLVDNPCNPDATFEVIKADGASELRKFAQPAAAGNAEGGAIAEAMAKAAEQQQEQPAAAAPAEPPTGPVQKWIATDGTSFDKKADAEAHMRKAKLDAEAAAVLAPALAAAAALEAALGKREGEAAPATPAAGGGELGKGDKPDGDYGDVKYADPGYQSDKKPRYPVDSEKHIRAAWSYINMPKNAAKYSSDQVGQIKGRIVSAWKAKIDSAGPESAAKAVLAENLAKSLWDIGGVACMVQELRCLKERLEIEAVCEGDDSTLADKAGAICGQVIDLLRALVAEETSEVEAGTEIRAPAPILAAYAHDRIDALSKLAGELDLAKAAPALPGVLDVMLKGAKHSMHDQAYLDIAHHAVTKAMGMDGVTQEQHGHLEKAASDLRASGAVPAEEENSTTDTGDNAEHDAPQGEKPPAAADPSGNHTVDTGHPEKDVPQGKKPPAGNPRRNATVDTSKFVIDEMAKRAGAHNALIEVAHHALSKVTDGKTCAVEKVGARHSAETMGHLTGAHDSLVKAGAVCQKSEPSAVSDGTGEQNAVPGGTPRQEGEAESQGTKNTAQKAEEGGDLAKVEGLLAAERDKNEALTKAFTGLTTQLEDLAKRLQVVEATPLPAVTAGPGAAQLPPGVHAVSKADDGRDGGGEAISDEAFMARVGKMSPDEIHIALVKATLNDPKNRIEMRPTFPQR